MPSIDGLGTIKLSQTTDWTLSVTRNKPEPRYNAAKREAAESMAIAALAFLASEPDHLGSFLAQAGIGPEDIRAAARDRNFLLGVLDHFANDETLLIAFARHQEIDPAEIDRARAALGGVWERDLP
jgi:Protein of unknown function (DUF3572)